MMYLAAIFAVLWFICLISGLESHGEGRAFTQGFLTAIFLAMIASIVGWGVTSNIDFTNKCESYPNGRVEFLTCWDELAGTRIFFEKDEPVKTE